MTLDSTYTTVTKTEALEQLASNQPPRTVTPRRLRNAIGSLYDIVSNISLSTFTATTAGTVPPSAGGTGKYIDSDGTWKTLPSDTAANVGFTGGGVGLFKQKASGVFQFKSLLAGSNVGITSTADNVTITVTGLATVATSGAYSDLTGRPTLSTVAGTGSYNDLTNRPTLSTVAGTGAYADLTGRPNLATVATSGAYTDLSGLPTLFSGAYADLTGRPTLSTVAGTGSYTDLLNRPNLAAVATSGAYADLTGTPTLAAVATSGAYNDLTGRPTLATVAGTGAYNDLTGRPTLSTVAGSGSFNDLLNRPIRNNTIVLMGNGYAANVDNDLPTGNHIVYSCSVVHLANIQLGSPLRIIGNTGVAGATSTQILTQVNSVLALSPEFVMLHAVTNDVVNGINAGAVGTTGSTIDNLHLIINQLSASGAKVILSKDLPRSGLTDAQAKQVANVYSFFTSNMRDYPNLYLLDMFRYGLDISLVGNTYTGVPIPSRYLGTGPDYINPSTETCLLASKQLMEIFIRAGVKPTITGLSYASDGSAASGVVYGFDGDESILTPNAYLTGIRGDGVVGAGFNKFGRVYAADYQIERFDLAPNAATTAIDGDVFIHTRRNAGRFIPMFDDGNFGNVVQNTIRSSSAALPTEYTNIRCNTLNVTLNNPLSLTSGSNVMTITYPSAHGLAVGSSIYINILSGNLPVGGLSGTNLNRIFTVTTVPSSTTVTVTLPVNATSNVTNGGGPVEIGVSLPPNSGPYIIETEIAVRVHSGSLAHLEFRLARFFARNTTRMRMLAPANATDFWNLSGTFDKEGVFDGIIRSEPFFTPNDNITERHQVQLMVGLQPNSEVSVWLGRLFLKRV